MKRRTVLGALSGSTATLAGCLGGNLGTSGDDPESNSGPATPKQAGKSSSESVASRFEAEPTRPECERNAETVEIQRGDETRTVETAATIPYPDPPESFTREDIVDHVEAFDRAYVTHDVLCGRLEYVLEIGYSVRAWETIDWYDEITVVFLLRSAGAIAGADDEGNMWEADIGISGVAYAVDESGVARVESDVTHPPELEDIESKAPDPVETGTLVARFE